MLDVWVLKQRERVFMEQSLEPISIHECEKENVLYTIYKEIEQEAAGLRDNGTYDYRLLLRYRLKNIRWKAVAAAKEADRRLQRFVLYRKYLRRLLKIFYGRRTAGRNINVLMLMMHRKETYVRLLYRKILNREPDAEGYSHNLHLLREKNANKLELLDAFCAVSREGGMCRKLTGRRLAEMVYGRSRKRKKG